MTQSLPPLPAPVTTTVAVEELFPASNSTVELEAFTVLSIVVPAGVPAFT
jgi:hypothetical protein